MTTFVDKEDLTKNAQDSTERHVFSELSPSPTGATVKVQGNGTYDDDCVVLSLGGTIHHLPKGTNAEVILIGGNDDTSQKYALIFGPRDKQYQGKEGQSWNQDPMDPKERQGYTKAGIRVVSAKSIGIGEEGAIEYHAEDNKIYLRERVYSKYPITVIKPPDFVKE